MTSMTANKRYGNKRRFEVASWYFMRVSGALLLLTANLCATLFISVVLFVAPGFTMA